MIEGKAYFSMRDALDGADVTYTIRPDYVRVRDPNDAIDLIALGQVSLTVSKVPEKPYVEPEYPDIVALSKETRERLSGLAFSNINGLSSEPHPKSVVPGISTDVLTVLRLAGLIPDLRGLGHREPSPLGSIAVNQLANGSVQMVMGVRPPAAGLQ